MKLVSLLLFAIVCFTLTLTPSCNSVNDEITPGDSLSAINMNLYWKAQNESLYVRLSGPTTGWISVGFESAPGMVMQGVNYIIAYVTDDSILHIQDNYGDTPTTHVADTLLGGIDNVRAIKGTEADGRTFIEFKIPLNSGDAFDRVLIEGNTYAVQLAYGPNGYDDYESLHEAYITVNIEI